MKWFISFMTILAPALWTRAACYDLVRDYSGQKFFDGWDFFGSWDNLTLGDVWWLNEADAMNQGLAYINGANNAILKVDNTTNVPFNEKRNTVRITTQDTYALGSLWMIDVIHLPYGCSVWPAFWTKGPLWPDDGEIDIIEAVNLMPANQMALHTTPGCTHPNGTNERGVAGDGDCSTAAGCIVTESSPNSFESGFAQMGGGVWACQFDVAGIFMWFWSRPNIPASITSANSTSPMDISQWGPPSASYPVSACNIPQFFTPQNLVLDITLCGDWAGIGPVYNASCGSSGPTGLCYNDNVVGVGSPKYDNAYFEIAYVRAYTTPTPTSTSASTSSSTSAAADSSLTEPVTTTMSEAGGMGGPTVVITNLPSASVIVSSSAAKALVFTGWNWALGAVGMGLVLCWK